jgi:hypothetical protein
MCNLGGMTTQLDRIETKLDRIEQRCNQIAQLVLSSLTGDQIMASKFEELKADVAAETTVVNSAITLLAGISARIDEAVAAARAGDDQALSALSSEVRSETQALAAAVAANTPGQPPSP